MIKKFLSKRSSSIWYAWIICALATLFYTYEYILRLEPGIMVHQLRTYFNITDGGLGLLASMYYWAYTPLQLLVGIFTDRFGPRHILISAIFVCILGSWIFGLTHFYMIAAGARFMIGMGSAFAFVGALKLAADWLPRQYFSFFVGLCTSVGMLGAMFGETIMSWIVIHFGWHRVIIDTVWLGSILIVVFYSFVYEKKHLIKKQHVVKPLNFRILTRSLMKILSSKPMLQAGLIGCSLYLSLSLVAEQWGNIYFQKVLHLNAEDASYFVDMIFFGWFIGSPLQGYLSERFNSRKKLLILGCIFSCLTLMPIILFPDYLSRWLLATLLFLFGLFSSSEINCFAIAKDLVDNRLTATAVGFMNACVMVSGMIIQPFFAFCLNLLSNTHHAMNYRIALMIVPFFLMISLITAFFMKDDFRREDRIR